MLVSSSNLHYIIGRKIPHDEPYRNLLLLLLEIMGIVLAPKINTDLARYLSHLVAEHHQTKTKRKFAERNENIL